MSGVAQAFVAGVEFIVAALGPDHPKPLKGVFVGERGDWKLTINASPEPAKPEGMHSTLMPWTIFAENTRYLTFGVFAPDGGLIGGMPEAYFIDEIERLTAEMVA
ncbi:MAG: hypothetical protein P0Y59_02705 [Candidatus Sphingomonas phytovorans]|nr:hypothetical protein [Sphingomonas sp.]WEK00622.1 MAG: hypothetical protein P0Y59_02705 [Sphingomonas sp.]